MCNKLKILWLLLYKNYIVRKRHLFNTIIEIFSPVFIILTILLIRSQLNVEPTRVNHSTYFPILTKDDLIDQVPRSMLHLYYKPQNKFTETLMNDVRRCMKLPHKQLYSFNSEDALLESYEIQQSMDMLISILAIDFNDTNDSFEPSKLKYTIRSSHPIPNKLFAFDFEDSSGASNVYIEKIPIITLQMCLDDAFIDRVAPDNVTKPAVVIQKMPYPPYDEINSDEVIIQNFMSTSGGLMFWITIYLISMYISAEKTTGVNILLKMNGVNTYQNFLSWLISGVMLNIISISIVTMNLKLNLVSDQKPFYYYSDCCIIWLALLINVTHVYAFTLHLASYFSKPWLTQLAAIIIPILATMAETQLTCYSKFGIIPILRFIFPTAAGVTIFNELNEREIQYIGIQWNNLFETASPTLSNMNSIGFIMLSSFMGIIFHFILALYLDAVLPSKYGVSKSPFFFLKYFKQNKICISYDEVGRDDQPEIFEPVADGTLVPGVQLRNLMKFFTCGCSNSHSIKAIRGISLDFYRGQITALLGHNGAGKTTTFSIMTGLTAPSGGTVTIDGKDISKDLDAIRSDLGVCPQENTMFPDLTVMEQLTLVGLLKQKNRTRKQLLQEIDDLLTKLDLTKKRNVMPKNLSGGQKRRLCLGMALIGDASTIFLDEPTSGMDPETSRGIWDIILKYRKQKTIIITTHSMEEADVLGDRIAIMHSGQMKCYGTPMFLKKFYGHKYHEVTLSTTSWYDEEKIQNIIGSDAIMNKTQHGKIIISMPLTNALPEILDNVENRKVELGITGVSVSMISLEQVFLKAAEREESNESADELNRKKEPVLKEYEYLTGLKLTCQMITALLTKKITYLKTDKNLFIAMMFGILLAVVLPVFITINNPKQTSSFLLDLGQYKNLEVLIASKNETLGEMYKKIIDDQLVISTFVEARNSLNHELLSRATADMTHYKTRMIISAEFNSSSLANALYSDYATLSAPITVNVMSNLVLKTIAGDQYSISAKIGDLPQSLIQDAKTKMMNRIYIMSRSILFVTIFFHIVACFVKHPLLETSTRVKQLQQMTGVPPFLYWGTTFVVDYIFYILLSVLTAFGIFFINWASQSYTMQLSDIGILLLLLLIFGINILLVAYIHSFMKKQFHIVYSILSGGSILIVFIIFLLYEILSCMAISESTNLIQRRIFSLQPHVSFTFGYMKFTEIVFDNARCRKLSNLQNKIACFSNDLCCTMQCYDEHCENPQKFFNSFRASDGFEEFFIYLLVTPILLIGILYLLEQQVFAKLRLKFQKRTKNSKHQDKLLDSEVEKEKSIVHQEINKRTSDLNYDDENVFLAYGLRKCYGKVEAVKEVNFRVKKNECFGLLGVNGAGKSTTFRMLVGEEFPTNGILFRDSYNIKSNRTEYLAGIGYCPQTNALIPYFNAMEHLSLFAKLRGVPSSEISSEVISWIDKLQLTKCARNPSMSYSGGNKRRLNIAMALIANPQMVLLDEPTTGVDPAARRSVWTTLQCCQTSGQAIILTSHSMEECEALCNRLVIMVQGRLLCVGASQELKKRFAAGFNITIKLNFGIKEEDFTEIKRKIENAFVCQLKDEHLGYLFYHVTDSEVTWVKMFETMNSIKSEYECIEDFTISSSTLEQLFMQFARSSANTTEVSHISNQCTGTTSAV